MLPQDGELLPDRDILVIDVEATCDDQNRVPRSQMEVIEIGAVLVDYATWEPRAEFQTFIRPVRYPALTEFCTELTTITQRDVDTAPGFSEAIESLRKFIEFESTGRRWPLFGSWGAYDKKQFQQDAAYHGVELPFGAGHLNIKEAFSMSLGTTKRYGMAAALRRLAIPLEGTHHRGIDDARHIAKILPYALGAIPMTDRE